jgi:site-specific recombinase XerC
MLDDYAAALRSAPLSDQTRRTYASKVRQYLAWLAGAALDQDPLTSADGRDWAVRDYRTHLQTVLKRSPATVNNALAAVDDFYIRRQLGPASAARVEISAAAPRALDHRAQLRYLRAVQARPSPRDQALALVPFYTGARISEIVALDIDDVARSARKGVLRILGKGERVRQVPIHPQLHAALNDWLAERADWPGATDTTALFLNQRGQRFSVRGAHAIVTGIAAGCGPRRRHDGPHPQAHVRDHARARRHRPRDRRRAARPRTPRNHPDLHPPQRRRPHTSSRPPPRRQIAAPSGSYYTFWAYVGRTPGTAWVRPRKSV